MINVELSVETALGWDGPRYKWMCPLCEDEPEAYHYVVYRETSVDNAVDMAVVHLTGTHAIDKDLIRISLEYWALRIMGPVTLTGHI